MECGGVSSLFVIVGIGLFYLERHKDVNLQEILFLRAGFWKSVLKPGFDCVELIRHGCVFNGREHHFWRTIIEI